MKKPTKPVAKPKPAAKPVAKVKPMAKPKPKPKPALKGKTATKPAAKPKPEAKVLTKHPDRTKKGANISKEKYEAVKAAILAAVPSGKAISFEKLVPAVEKKLGKKFEGSVSWYVTTVKLDLEARKLIKREGDSPQMISQK